MTKFINKFRKVKLAICNTFKKLLIGSYKNKLFSMVSNNANAKPVSKW